MSFTLHQSFAVPLRELTAAPYEVHEEGWGEFDVAIKVCRGTNCCVALQQVMLLLHASLHKGPAWCQACTRSTPGNLGLMSVLGLTLRP